MTCFVRSDARHLGSHYCFVEIRKIRVIERKKGSAILLKKTKEGENEKNSNNDKRQSHFRSMTEVSFVASANTSKRASVTREIPQ